MTENYFVQPHSLNPFSVAFVWMCGHILVLSGHNYYLPSSNSNDILSFGLQLYQLKYDLIALAKFRSTRERLIIQLRWEIAKHFRHHVFALSTYRIVYWLSILVRVQAFDENRFRVKANRYSVVGRFPVRHICNGFLWRKKKTARVNGETEDLFFCGWST